MPGGDDSWRQKLAGTFELPRDIVLDLPRVTILGALQVSIENHRGIIRYSPERVVVAMNKGRIVVAGKELVIGVIHEEELTVTGHIDSISFERVG